MNECPHCGMAHGVRCPFVSALEYHQDGTIKRVEFFKDWQDTPFESKLFHHDIKGHIQA